MSNPREAAQKLYARALESKVKFPKIWDESKSMQNCGALLMTHRSSDGFNLDAALQDLIDRHGQEEQPKSSGNKRKKLKDDGDAEGKQDEDEGSSGSTKKVKKTDVVAEERNRPVAEAIKEMADIYFKNKDMRKGGVFSKAAKAIRECETYISTQKEAMALKGVGKGIASYIVEMVDNGSIEKLEELKAGVA